MAAPQIEYCTGNNSLVAEIQLFLCHGSLMEIYDDFSRFKDVQ